MSGSAIQTDRRKNRRSQVQEGAFVLLRPNSSILGHLVEIGPRGLSFIYITTDAPKYEAYELEILLADQLAADHGFYLDKVPFKTISDLVVPNPFSLGCRTIRRRGVQFGELSVSQRRALGYLIKYYTIGEN